MESENKTGWAFGVISKKRGENCGQIKSLALIDDNKKISKKLDETGSIECFPPNGFVFAPLLLFEDNHLEVGDTVIFRFEENKQRKYEEYDSFIVSHDTLSKKGHKIFQIPEEFIEDKKILRIDELQEVPDLSDNILLFLGTSDLVIGELKISNGKIRPRLRKKVKVWKRNDCINNIFEPKDGPILYDTPGNEVEYWYIDCMDSKQLSEWFREQLKRIDPVFIKQLDDTTKWREILPKMFDDTDAHLNELNEIRLNRVVRILGNIAFTWTEIEALSKSIPGFEKIYSDKIETFREEYKSGFEKEFEKERNKQNQEISNREKKIQKLENDIAGKKKELEKLVGFTAEREKTLNHIEANKDRLLKDFSIFQSVTNLNRNQSTISFNQELSYIIEDQKPVGTPIERKEDFLERLRFFLSRYKIKHELSNRLLNAAAAFRCFFVPKISFGIAFAEAVGNTKYIVQQVEPDWLHFKNFWESGLGTLWTSSHNEPNRLHLLALEDINLASPECWGRPLLDVLAGFRKKIPFGNSSWPSNFKIVATHLPSENPKIGLPLYKQTFLDWGAVMCEDFRSDIEESIIPKEAYITPQQLEKWKPDELEIDNMQDDSLAFMDTE